MLELFNSLGFKELCILLFRFDPDEVIRLLVDFRPLLRRSIGTASDDHQDGGGEGASWANDKDDSLSNGWSEESIKAADEDIGRSSCL